MEVSSRVSPIAALTLYVKRWWPGSRRRGKAKGIVMDGRDIGTTVFPDAELRFCNGLPNPKSVHSTRYDELKAKGEEAGFDEILENVRQRTRPRIEK